MGEECRRCKGVLYHEHDRYCSACGHSLFGHEIMVSRLKFFALDQPQAGKIVIENTGSQVLPIYSTKAAPKKAWLQINESDKSEQDKEQKIVLPPDSEQPCTVRFTIDLGDKHPPLNGDDTTLVVETAAGKEEFTISLVPLPEPTTTPIRDSLVRWGRSFEHSIEFKLTTGSLVKPVELRFSCPGADSEPVSWALLSNGHFSVRVRFDPKRLPEQKEKGPVKACLEARFEEVENVQRWPVELVVREPACTNVDNPPNLGGPLYVGERPVKRDFRLCNRGDVEDAVEVKLCKSPDELETYVPYAEVICDGDIKNIPAKGNVPCTLVYDPYTLQPGSYPLWLVLRFGDERKSIRIDCQFEVETMPEATLVAFDLGTSNSCVAWSHDDFQTDLIDLDTDKSEPSLRQVIPSVIAFKDTDCDPPEYKVGHEAGEYRRGEGHAIFSIKRRVGCTRKEEVRVVGQQKKEYEPWRICSFIIADLVRRMKESVRHRPGRLVFAIPPTFGGAEIAAIKKACIAAGLEGEALRLVDEPVAAATYFIINSRRRKNGNEGSMYELGDEYVLAVCDVGGGTTDISFLRVRDHTEDKQRVIDVEVLFAGGNPAFGGDDITNRLALHLYARAKEQWDSEEDFERLFPIITPEQVLAGSNFTARLNWGRLWEQAEKKKKELSRNEEVDCKSIYLESDPGVRRDEEAGRDFKLGEISVEDLDQLIREDVEVIVRTLQDIEAKLQEKSRVPPPSVLLLAGQTSQLPPVRDRIGGSLPQAKSEFLRDYCKQAVATGALDFAQLLDLPNSAEDGVRLNLKPHIDRCPVSIGIVHAGMADGTPQPMFQPVIEQFAPLDREYEVMRGPAGKKKRFELHIYESYGPNNRVRGNRFVKCLGKSTVELPEGTLSDAEVRVTMKVDAEARKVTLRAYFAGTEPREFEISRID